MTLYLRRFEGLTSFALKRASFQRCSMGPEGARASSCIGSSLSNLRSSELALASLHEAEEDRERQEHVASRHEKSEASRGKLQLLVVARVIETHRLQHAVGAVIEVQAEHQVRHHVQRDDPG